MTQVVTVEDYLKLPYTVEVQRDLSGDFQGWFAQVKELPGCMTQAERFEELESMVEDAMRAWIEIALEDGKDIPLPAAPDAYSGKFLLRMPRSLHRRLAEAAARESVSVNQFLNVALSDYLGRLSAAEETREAKRPVVYEPRKLSTRVAEGAGSPE
jgi:predicted RNase H-like HicB family nuclease